MIRYTISTLPGGLMKTNSNVSGFDKLQKAYPYPTSTAHPYTLHETYTSDGKSIIIEYIYKHKISQMMEVGSFFGRIVTILAKCMPYFKNRGGRPMPRWLGRIGL